MSANRPEFLRDPRLTSCDDGEKGHLERKAERQLLQRRSELALTQEGTGVFRCSSSGATEAGWSAAWHRDSQWV